MLKKSASGVLASLRGSTYRSVRLASSLAAALLDGLFEHPAGVFSSSPKRVSYRSSAMPKWLFRSLLERASPIMLPSHMPLCFLLGGLIMGSGSPILAQVPGRAATPSGPVGASMAVLAMLQDADVLPPEGTPEANRVIKAVIQFQSVFLKSGDPAVQAFLSHALAAHRDSGANEAASQFRSAGWTSDVLEALSEQWVTTAIDQRERLEPGFRQFNISLADFDSLMELVAKARTALEQRGQNMHQVFAQRRREMPGGAQ